MTGYYDVVLGLIPVALGGITGALTFAGFSLTAAVPIASIVAVALIGHAMFVRAPVDVEETDQRPSIGAQTPVRRRPDGGQTAD